MVVSRVTNKQLCGLESMENIDMLNGLLHAEALSCQQESKRQQAKMHTERMRKVPHSGAI